MKRRNFIKKSVTASIGLLSFPHIIRSSPIVNIGYIPITDAAPLLAAYELGYFKEEKLTVNPPQLVRSWSILAESFISGKFNLAHLLFPIPIWLRYSLKKPVKIMAWDHCNGSAITVSKKNSILNFSDFSKKTIAIPYWFSIHNMLLQMGIREAGLTPELYRKAPDLKPNEVKLIVMPPPEMPSALSAGRIDGFIVAEPFNALAEIKIKAKIFRFTGDIWQNHPCCVVVMNDQMANHDPVTSQKIMNAVTRAQLWLTHHPLEASLMLSSDGKGYLPVSSEVLKKVFTYYSPENYQNPTAIKNPDWPVSRIDFQPYPYPSATKLIIDNMKKTKVEGDTVFLQKLKTSFVMNDLVNDTYVKNSILSLGGPEIFPRLSENHNYQRTEIISL